MSLEKARQLYAQGESFYLAGNYLEAVRLFEGAYAESKRPALLWNIASSYRRQYEIDHDEAHLRRARQVYANYAELADNRKARTEAKREADEVDRELKRLERERAAATATTTTAPPKTAPPTPPTPKLAQASGSTSPPVPSTTTRPSPRTDLVTPPPHAEPGAPVPVYRRWWLWTAVAGGAVVAGVAVGLGVGLGARDANRPDDVPGGVHVPVF